MGQVGGDRGPARHAEPFRRGAAALLLVLALAACTSTPGPRPPTYDPFLRPKTPAVVEPEPSPKQPPEQPPEEPPAEPWGYGDDPYLDSLWDGCTAGDADACDALYVESPVGSSYEEFGATCGGRTDGGGCAAAPGPVEGDFAEYAVITTWYSAAEADDSAWVHFKAVDESGVTVQEIAGSDLMDLVEEAGGMAQTAERTALVDGLRQMMAADGWTELGLGGEEWYQYVYGR